MKTIFFKEMKLNAFAMEFCGRWSWPGCCSAH